MGRIVSCKQCGAWGELLPDADPADWLCAQCAGTADGPQESAEQGSASASPAQPSAGAGPSIGRDSGAIGAGSLDLSHALLDEQLREMQTAVDSIRVGSVDIEAIQERLAAGSKRVSVHGTDESIPWAPLLSSAADKAGDVVEDVVDQARAFARQQAGEVIDRAEKLVEDKGLGAVAESGDFARREAVRVANEARRLAARKARDAATKAAKAGRRAVTRSSAPEEPSPPTPAPPTVKRAIPKQASAVCSLCGDRIVLGDHVVSCPDCGEHYHADCYKMLGVCVSESCRGKPQTSGYQVVEPAPEPQRAVTPKPTARRCLSCGSAVSSRALVCPQCGAWLSRRKRQPTLGRRYNNASPFPEGCTSVVVAIVAMIVAIAFGISAVL
jgi:predicted RNA-binding Zn-ribbon protein involved in translation (DUF1610 family)